MITFKEGCFTTSTYPKVSFHIHSQVGLHDLESSFDLLVGIFQARPNDYLPAQFDSVDESIVYLTPQKIKKNEYDYYPRFSIEELEIAYKSSNLVKIHTEEDSWNVDTVTYFFSANQTIDLNYIAISDELKFEDVPVQGKVTEVVIEYQMNTLNKKLRLQQIKCKIESLDDPNFYFYAIENVTD